MIAYGNRNGRSGGPARARLHLVGPADAAAPALNYAARTDAPRPSPCTGPQAAAQRNPGEVTTTMTQVRPIHRFILAVDIEGSTSRTNAGRARFRRVMYDLVEEALDAGGMTDKYRDPLIDRGDGILIL